MKNLTLQTKRLTLHPLRREDGPNFYLLQSNAEVMHYISNGPKTPEESDHLFQKLLAHQEKHHFSLGPVYHKNTLIGFAGLIHLALDDTNPEIEISYYLLPSHWNKGYATELTQALIHWAFQHLPITILLGIAHPQNTASQHVLQKCGLHLVGPSTYRGKPILRFEIPKPQ